MSEAPVTEAAAAAPAPQLLHSGTYALYKTPAGGLHIVFRRTAGWDDETGTVRPIEGAEDEHMPELGPGVVAMFDQIQAGGRPSPMAMVKAVMGMNGGGPDVAAG
jgi:hypothetical protein